MEAILVSQISLIPSSNKTLLFDLKNVSRQPNNILLPAFIEW